MIRIVIADSNHLIRAGLNAVLSQYDDFELVGEADSSEKLIDLVRHFRPDVVLVDFAARDFSVDVVQRCLRVSPQSRLVAITPEQSGVTIVNALRAGITSYIKTDCDVHEIVHSIRETNSGGRFFCGQILESIRRESIEVDDLEIRELSCEPVSISERELEVIRLIAEGYTNNEIATKLFLSPHTVNTHRKNIMQKLGVNNTAAIVLYAVKTELVSPNKFLFSPVNQA
ncbi:MAG: LuxR C-terminal-related transcriptional regulator [Flavobacteriales bacterium]|jgi:DNA-binding NarL/FixJ family response regulator